MKKIELDEDSALVLQQIEEAVEEDIDNLNESLRFGHSYLAHILGSLQNKGLIIINGHWISLSAKGKKTTDFIWPKLDYIHF
jgi:predicted transcriptional regulator